MKIYKVASMNCFIAFLPIVSFLILYVGTGIYFTISGVDKAFYQISPTVAIIPSIILGWSLHHGKTAERMKAFLDGVRHPDIITMCIVFLLAGAFSSVTNAIGSVDSTVNVALTLIPSKFLLINIFLMSAFISTSIGTSMGTIATIAPLAAGLITQGAFPAAIGMATVVGGAMFGDNLSFVSDTTIASVMSQEADMKAKFKLNAKIALISGFLTVLLLSYIQDADIKLVIKEYSLILITPYLLLILLAILGINVFVILIIAIIYAAFIGWFNSGYTLIQFSSDISKGFAGVQEIMLLSLMVGGLSGLANEGFHELSGYLEKWIARHGTKKMAQLVIAKIVSIFDILIANNTVAIVFSGGIARNIAKKYHIPPHYTAAWLDIFSCVFQGLIPYGAQILLASTIAGISPLSITPYVYYCYILAVVSVLYILINKSDGK